MIKKLFISLLILSFFFSLTLIHQHTTNLKQIYNHFQRKETGYTSDNQECINKCLQAKGYNCGKNWQNCCQTDNCDQGWITEICYKRIKVQGCTEE